MATPPEGKKKAAASAPAAVSVLERLNELSAELSELQSEAELLLRQIDEVPSQIEVATGEYQQAFSAADEQGMAQAREAIAAANEDRRTALAELPRLLAPLDDLVKRHAAFRTEALGDLDAARLAAEEARRTFIRKSHEFEGVGGLACQIREVRSQIEKALPAEPKPAPAAEPVAAEPAGVPKCPRCLRNDHVSPDGPGRWRCSAAYHGPLKFNREGEETRKGVPSRV